MKNESNKHYLSLNRPDYTCYPKEEEIILQAGLKAEIISVESENIGIENKLTVFELYITEKRQRHY